MLPKFNVSEGSGSTTAQPGQVVNPPKGKLANPFPGAARGTPFDPAGAIRGRPHRGIDMAKDSNPSTMLAAFSGKVVDVQSGCVVGDSSCGGGFGNLVEIAGEGEWEGYSVLYAHLASVSVQMGQKVRVGQAVGIEGNTGASGGLHLHFELRKGGSPIDPEPYLSPCPTETYGQGDGTPLRCSN
jgi:murein DD-endopeptidase MepM/ murein hydrolase activator NlpD